MGGATLNQKRRLGCVDRGHHQEDKGCGEDCTQAEYSDKPEMPPYDSPVVPKANLLLFDNRFAENLCILSARRKGQPKRRRRKVTHIALSKSAKDAGTDPSGVCRRCP